MSRGLLSLEKAAQGVACGTASAIGAQPPAGPAGSREGAGRMRLECFFKPSVLKIQLCYEAH